MRKLFKKKIYPWPQILNYRILDLIDGTAALSWTGTSFRIGEKNFGEIDRTC